MTIVMQGRRENLKIQGETSSNLVGIICPPPLILIGLTDLSKSVWLCPPGPSGSDSPAVIRSFHVHSCDNSNENDKI